MILLAVAFLLIAIGAGFSALTPWTRRLTLLERLAAAVPFGIAINGLLGFALALLLPLGVATTITAAASLAIIVFGLWKWYLRPARGRPVSLRTLRLRPRLRDIPGILVGAALVWLLIAFFLGACRLTPDGGIESTNPANLGDLPYHIAIVRGFTDGNNFPPEHPEFAGARLTYPFLVDFGAAQLVAAGASVVSAFALQNVALILSFAFLICRLARSLTRQRRAGLLALVITLFSGGWGFVRLASDANPDPWTHPTHDVCLMGEELRWGNLLCVLLGTQRSLLLGMPLAIAVWLLWWRARADTPTRPRSRETSLMIGAGLLCGVLPLGHIHTFMTALMLGGVHALRSRRWRSWIVFFAVAILLALPQMCFLLSNSQTKTGQFVSWMPGWDTHARSPIAWVRFWLYNTGPLIPLLVVSVNASPNRLRGFWWPSLLCFVVPNLFQLAPWIWDNLKVLIYWHIAAAPLIAGFLCALWRRHRVLAPAVITLVFLLIASGGWDVRRVLLGSSSVGIFDSADLALADTIRAATPPGARLLTAPTYNHPAFAAGRRVWCGYGGHLWSHGLDYQPRETDLKRIYAGEADAESLMLAARIDFVVIGSRERGDSNLSINNAFWNRFPIVARSGASVVYDVRRLHE